MAAQTSRTAIVTGAARGPRHRRRRAARLAADGFAVGVVDLDEGACKETVDAITAAGGSAVAAGVDVDDEKRAEDAVARVAEALGPLRSWSTTPG